MKKLDTEQVTILYRFIRRDGVLSRNRRRREAIPYVVYLQSHDDTTYGWNWENAQGETAVPEEKIGYHTKKQAIESAISHFSTGEYILPY